MIETYCGDWIERKLEIIVDSKITSIVELTIQSFCSTKLESIVQSTVESKVLSMFNDNIDTIVETKLKSKSKQTDDVPIMPVTTVEPKSIATNGNISISIPIYSIKHTVHLANQIEV